MTYKELLQKLQELNREQLEQDITIYDFTTDEVYRVIKSFKISDSDVLGNGHYVLGYES